MLYKDTVFIRSTLEISTGCAYSFGMDTNKLAEIWIAACAHRLQQHWRTVDPIELEEVAAELWRNERLRELPPAMAAAEWLSPIEH
ncbi:hypothetical protein QTH87_06065 [Variovorax sp. J22P168]|uniref:hypothetical protein n=1 Tax=Variovorax jilinensis TaxID=3053513 RepID=UPI0025776590|nr:hypothetical protein [Variovorax sp. J22P168]MDM0012004.1 hypothetical protein [Variovorax sp. J22P168]